MARELTWLMLIIFLIPIGLLAYRLFVAGKKGGPAAGGNSQDLTIPMRYRAPASPDVPDALEAVFRNAVSTGGEYAWKRSDLDRVFQLMAENGRAALGGEAWAVIDRKELQGLRQLTVADYHHPKYGEMPAPLTVTKDHFILGIIPCQDGETCVFSFNNKPRRETESWRDFVERSVAETKSSIEDMDAEANVKPIFTDLIYYNLSFVTESEYAELSDDEE